MPTDPTSTQNPAAPHGDPAQPAPDPKTVTPPETKADVKDAIAKEEHLKIVEKVRTEEKNKLYPELQKLKGERDEKEKELTKFKAEADELRTKLQTTTDSTLTEQQKFEKRLSDLEARIKRSEAEKDAIVAQSDKRVAELELRLYRERKVREAGIELIELVTGTTPEEIDASIEKARTREADILGKAKDKLRKDVAEELGRNLPTEGASPTDDGRSKAASMLLTPRQRTELGKIRDPQKYREARDRLVAEARNRLPDGHPLKAAAAGA